MNEGGGIKRAFFAALCAVMQALESWQLTKARWFHDAAKWADDKAKGGR